MSERAKEAAVGAAWKAGDHALYTWAYDGSGVALRTEVEVVEGAAGAGKAVVRVISWDQRGYRWLAERGFSSNGVGLVHSEWLSAVGSVAHVASFGWLD